MKNNVVSIVNEQSAVPLDAGTEQALAEEEQRIRDLVGVTRGCIIEIGRTLIAARARVGHGKFLAWIDQKFGWSDRTAERYISIAEAFKFDRLSSLGSVTITGEALYLLSRPSVPQEIRDEAVDRAEEGERITLAEAEQLIIARVTAELEQQRQAAKERLQEAIDAVTKATGAEVERLQTQVKELEAAAQAPGAHTVIDMVCKVTGKKKLSKREMQGIALALGTPVSDGERIHPAATPGESAAAEQNLKISSQFARAIECLGGIAWPPGQMLQMCQPWMLQMAHQQIPGIIDYLREFRELLAIHQGE